MNRFKKSLSFIFIISSAQIALCIVTIIERSPFVWDGYQPPNSAIQTSASARQTAPSNYEFSGVFSLSGTYFVLFGEQRKEAKWFRVPSDIDGVEIIKYNQQDGKLLVNDGLKEIWIEMKTISKNSNPIPVQGLNSQVSQQNSNGNSISREVSSSNRRRVVRPSASSRTTRISSSSSTRDRPIRRGISADNRPTKDLSNSNFDPSKISIPQISNPTPPDLGDLKPPSPDVIPDGVPGGAPN